MTENHRTTEVFNKVVGKIDAFVQRWEAKFSRLSVYRISGLAYLADFRALVSAQTTRRSRTAYAWPEQTSGGPSRGNIRTVRSNPPAVIFIKHRVEKY